MKIVKHLVVVLIVILISSCKKETIEVDILIKNGTVYNGISTKPTHNFIAIKNDKIVLVDDKNLKSIKAERVIDASGLIVSPGFIDPHTHADRDLNIPENSHNKPFLFQGITTVITGNDGDSFFPMTKYTELYKAHGIGTNVVPLVGHGTIRNQVMGKSDRKATSEEILKMQELIQQEMESGAFGISTGLFYSPGSYSDTEEVIALAKIVAKNNGIYDTHLRDESSYTVGLIQAVKEVIQIGKEAELPVHISHIKCLGVDVWNESKNIIKLVEEAKEEGVELTANQYPYDASATGLKAAVVSRWAESGGKDSLFYRYNNARLRQQILKETKRNIARRGGPEKLLIVKAVDSSFVGKNLLELSQTFKTSPEVAVYKALATGYIRVASFNMNPNDIHAFMKQDWVVTGSDGNTGHPRKYGSFPRKYYKYVQQEKVIDLPTFINNSTSKTADIFKIEKRGKLQKGYFADIIIFNPKTFRDRANYTDAFQLADGLEYSIINGKIAVDNGAFTQKLNGRVLKK